MSEIDEHQARNHTTLLAIGVLLVVVLTVVTTRSLLYREPRKVLASSPINELPPEARQIFDSAMEIEICWLSQGEGIKAEKFTNYPVSGRLKVLQQRDRDRLRMAIYQGVEKADSGVIPCFDPGVAIRAVNAGKSMALVICFECDRINYYIDDELIGGVGTASDASLIIAELLRQHTR